MSYKKVEMQAFIVNFFKVENQAREHISVLFNAIVPVERAAGVVICESVEPTLESLLEPLLTYPEHFELSTDADTIMLRNPESLDELVKMWPVSSDVTEAITEHMKLYNLPMMYAEVSLDFAEQNEKYIGSNTKYIDWIWDRLEQNYKPNTKLTKESCRGTPEDLANIVRISDLYTLLSRSYSKNYMNYYGTERTVASYIFHYSRNGIKRYFKVERQWVNDGVRDGKLCYTVSEHRTVKNVPYFPDVVLAVPSELLKEREKVFTKLKELMKNARDISLSYDAIVYELGIIYGRIIDPRD